MLSPTDVRYYEFGEYRLDIVEYQLTRNEVPISLTHKSLEILIFLIQNRDKILGKDEIFDNVWVESYVEETNLTQHIYRIRKSLDDTENAGVYIETIPKHGYRFIAEVKEIPAVPKDIEIENDSAESDINRADQVGANRPVQSNALTTESKQNPTNREAPVKSNLTSATNKRLALAVFIGVILALGMMQIYTYYYPIPKPIVYKSVAVFPFKYVGNNKDEKLELGVADTLISKLGNYKEFSVIPTESIVSYSNKDFQSKNHNIFQIGDKLGADIVLTGTIQRQDDIVRYSVRYYSIKQKRQLCTMKFDEKFTDVFSLQDSISEKATQKLLLEIKEHLNSATHLESPKESQ